MAGRPAAATPELGPAGASWLAGTAVHAAGGSCGAGTYEFWPRSAAGAALAGMAGKDMAGAAKGAVLAGAGYAAWQFFKKWSANRQAQPAPLPGPDPQALLAVRAVVYATRADGVVDAEEQARITSAM